MNQLLATLSEPSCMLQDGLFLASSAHNDHWCNYVMTSTLLLCDIRGTLGCPGHLWVVLQLLPTEFCRYVNDVDIGM